MKHNYKSAIDFVFKYEGGYVNHPRDPGGPTNRGITLNTARAFWKPDATAEDVKAMPKSVAENIYRKQYADKVGFDTLPAGLDLLCFDAAVLSGPARAKSWLKEANTIDAYQARRLAFYKGLKTWPTFGPGWTNRLNAGTKLANSLPQKEPTTSPVAETIKKVVVPGIVLGTGASQVPSHWYDALMTPQALMIGFALVAATIAIGYYVLRRYKAYKDIKGASVSKVN